MATPIKGRFVVFSKWLLIMIGYIGLGDCPAGLKPPTGVRNRKKNYCENTKKRPLRGIATKGTLPKNWTVKYINKDNKIQK